ncbi:uncharacterized protein LOC142985297 [Anticarsia gemmatalis]|uniref:uncharacterized protein LOC142985297 n=1 Tax=Anticarsia gemmatalis TaxID=129554 RepID=UPI003F7740AD
MTSRLHLLLAATCALALIQLASGQAKCASDSWGASPEFILQTAIIPAGLRHQRIRINPLVGCLVRGEKVTACDHDLEPLVYLTDREVNVHRRGNLRLPAVVYIKQACRKWGKPDLRSSDARRTQTPEADSQDVVDDYDNK